jgi:AraC family transcriptional regulator
MDGDASLVIHARDLTALDSIPGPVTSSINKSKPLEDLFAIDLGPSSSSDRFSIPALEEHAIALTINGHGDTEGWISGKYSLDKFESGRLALVPAGADSEWRICNGSCSNFNIFLTHSLLARSAAQTLAIDPNRAKPIPLACFNDPLIFQIGMEISRAVRKPEFSDLLYLESLSYTLAVHLLHNYVSSPAPVPEVKGRLSPMVLKQVLDFVDASSNDNLSLGRMADMAHLSPFHFERLFKASMGRTVHQYVLTQRLEKSYRLLLTSNLTIAQIAAETGFADQSHFERRFKSLFGVPPGVLRKDRKVVP